MCESNRHYPHTEAWAVDWELVKDLPFILGNSEWQVWETNIPVDGHLRTVVAAFWHIPTKKLWVDPVICGDQAGIELAIQEKVAIVLDDRPQGVFLAAPADWTREKFPLNSTWVAQLERRFRQRCACPSFSQEKTVTNSGLLCFNIT